MVNTKLLAPTSVKALTPNFFQHITSPNITQYVQRISFPLPVIFFISIYRTKQHCEFFIKQMKKGAKVFFWHSKRMSWKSMRREKNIIMMENEMKSIEKNVSS